MNQSKLETIINLFEKTEIRSVWNATKEEYYFSVVDVVAALTNSSNPRHYWAVLKSRLKTEGSEVVTKCDQLKMMAPDGKMRLRDAMPTDGIFRLIESVPSPKAEPFKMWLASLGKERVDEVFNPEIAIDRAITYYRNKGHDDRWIESRLKGILDRKKLTNTWKERGISEEFEYGILTNEIYKTWSGMKASEYKIYKGIRKESLRDNMTDIEILLADIGEITTRELAKKYKPLGLEQNKKVAQTGGKIAKNTRKEIENKLGETVISSRNNLNYQYIDDYNNIEK